MSLSVYTNHSYAERSSNQPASTLAQPVGYKFSRSLRNEYDLVERTQEFATAKIMAAAGQVSRILGVSYFERVSSRTLNIRGNDYQAITVKYTNSAGQSCTAEISMPLDFPGDVRIWTNDRANKRVWATVERLERAQPDPTILFLFLARKFDELDHCLDQEVPF